MPPASRAVLSHFLDGITGALRVKSPAVTATKHRWLCSHPEKGSTVLGEEACAPVRSSPACILSLVTISSGGHQGERLSGVARCLSSLRTWGFPFPCFASVLLNPKVAAVTAVSALGKPRPGACAGRGLVQEGLSSSVTKREEKPVPGRGDGGGATQEHWP